MKIIRVVDTREYDQGPDDKWFPIPGSGDTNICDRCNKGHEVHYHVEIEPGKEVVVGGGCAKKEGLISESQHKSLGSAIMTLSKNKAELEKLTKNKKIQDEIWIKVNNLEIPEIICGEFVDCKHHFSGRINQKATLKMGDCEVNVHKSEYTPEYQKELSGFDQDAISWNRKQNDLNIENGKIALLGIWKGKRFKELAPEGFKQVAEYMICDSDFRVQRAEKKIKKLMEGN